MALRDPKRQQAFLEKLRKARIETGFTHVEAAEHLCAAQEFVSEAELGVSRIDPVEIEESAEL